MQLIAHEATPKMLSLANAAILVLFFILVIDIHHGSAFLFPVNCSVTSWSYWSSCNASTCGRRGSQTRSRSITTHPLSGGNTCPSNLRESRLCYGSRRENCKLSSWSQWSTCSAIRCGSSAMQTSIRHKITTEKCGGWCTSTFRKTRMCFSRPVNCKLSSWSEWNTCNGTVCTAGHGTQVSFRHKTMKEFCGGTCTSTLRRTRNCFNSITRKAVECQLNPWSEWGDCERTSCQLSGIQTRTRNKTVKEECLGTCIYALHQTKLCTQSQRPCFNGGTYKPNITGCVCMQGYSGVCCEKSAQGSDGVYERFFSCFRNMKWAIVSHDFSKNQACLSTGLIIICGVNRFSLVQE